MTVRAPLIWGVIPIGLSNPCVRITRVTEDQFQLRSCSVGSVPVVKDFIGRLGLDEFLARALAPAGVPRIEPARSIGHSSGTWSGVGGPCTASGIGRGRSTLMR
jgi:hypothetical protein